MALGGRVEALLQRHWWRPRPSWLSIALSPLSWVYRALSALARRRHAEPAPVPVVVVGNLVAGGAGKTPTVVALIESLQAAGWHPGVVSRGHGSRHDGTLAVELQTDVRDCGDEPLLIRRRSSVPVWVGRWRADAARALCAAHPEVDLLVADDGLQHAALARTLEIVVFDERGVGNGRLLPAGPLREPMPTRWPETRLVLYNATKPSTSAPGALAERRPGAVQTLADWRNRSKEHVASIETLRGRRLLAAAGIASPERFFSMLEDAGLEIDRLPLPDHARFDALPWPASTPEVVVTEKDAVKIDPARLGKTMVWVVGLDFRLPTDFVQAVLQRLARRPS